jgi:hypothetical protein
MQLLSPHERIIRAMFIKAQSQELRIYCGSPKVAVATRFRAYQLIRQERSLDRDQELLDAAASVSLSVEGSVLIASPKDQFAGILAITEALGQVTTTSDQPLVASQDPAFRTAEERELDDILTRLKAVQAEAACETHPQPARSTPYYNREG